MRSLARRRMGRSDPRMQTASRCRRGSARGCLLLPARRSQERRIPGTASRTVVPASQIRRAAAGFTSRIPSSTAATAARARSSFGRTDQWRARTRYSAAPSGTAPAARRHGGRGCPARNIAQAMSGMRPLCARPGTALPALGKFPHEAAVVDTDTGYVYLTEDDYESRLYRFRPDVSGRPQHRCARSGGAAIRRFDRVVAVRPDRPYRGKDTTPFARGEGAWFADGIVYFCTTADHRVSATPSRPGRSK